MVTWTVLDLLFAGWSLNPGTGLAFYQSGDGALRAQAAVGSGRVFLSEQEEYDLKFKRFLRFQDYSMLEPWANLPAILLPDTNLLAGVAMVNNFDPLVPGRYARWMQSLEQQPDETRAGWLALMNVSVQERIDLTQHFGIRYDPAGGSGEWFWYNCVTPVPDEEFALAQVTQNMKLMPGITPKPLVVEGGSLPGGNCLAEPAGTVEVLKERAGEYQVETDSTQGGWVFAAISWYPGWQADVDGRPVTIYHGDYLFWAIPVQAGKHILTVKYSPIGFYFGAMFSILTLFVYFIFGERFDIQVVSKSFR